MHQTEENKFLKNLQVLSLKIHKNNVEKGFWPQGSKEDLYFKDQALGLVITELSEALEALRVDRFANVEKFDNCLAEVTFVQCFQDYIKDSFEDEMADAAIRLLDLAAGFDMDIENVISAFNEEYYSAKDIAITHLPSNILVIMRSVTDIKFTAFEEQYVGEALAKIFYMMEFLKKDLSFFIDSKMKFNKSRPKKHNKNF